MTRVVLAAACAVLLLPVLAIAAGTGVISGMNGMGGALPSIDDVPASYMQLYHAAARRYRLPWELLAAIGKVECDHGRDPDPSCTQPGAENYAGAGGPMQFIGPSWDAYRVDGDADGRADRWNPADAIPAAARYLRAHGAPANTPKAIYGYNHSSYYVHQVSTLMEQYRQQAAAATPPADGASPPIDGVEIGDRRALAHAVLTNPRLQLRPEAVLDVRAGRIDTRLLGTLLAASQRFTLAGIGPFITGHSTYVAGTGSVSNHTVGRAVDIGTVNGQLVRSTSPATRQLVIAVAALPAQIRPTEIGSPFSDIAGCAGCFTDAAHADHVHLAFDD